MGFWTSNRHDPEFLTQLLFEVLRTLSEEFGVYERNIALSTDEAARAFLCLKLFPVSIADSFAKNCSDPKCHLAFIDGYARYLISFPDQDQRVDLERFVIQGAERSEFNEVFQKRFQSTNLDHFFVSPVTPSYKLLLQGMAFVRMKQYEGDIDACMRTNPLPMSGATLLELFKIFGDGFTRQVLKADDRSDEKYRASVGCAAAMYGKGWFKAKDLLKKL